MKPQKKSQNPVHFIIALVLVSTLFLSGCVSGYGEKTRPTNPAEQLLFDADKAAEAQNPQKALESYLRFLRDYPEHPSVPKVLLRTGKLYNDVENYTQAFQTFNELIRKYPGSSESEAASLGLCRSLYDSGRQQEGFACIDRARMILRAPQSRVDLAVLHADFLARSGKGIEAADSLEEAMEELPEAYHAQILDAFFLVAKTMDPGDIEALIPEARWPEPAATITLTWGLQLVETGQYRKAERSFQKFLSSFPNHRKRSMVKDLIASIKDKHEVDLLSIGCLLPLSGRFAALGDQAMRGIKTAMDIYGEKPDALPVRVRIENTLSDDTATISSLEKLNEDLVMAAIGPIGASLEVIRSASASGLPLITFTQQDGVTGTGANVFRNFMTPAMQVDLLVSYLIETRGLSRFAILYPKDAYGENFRDLFWDKVKKAGGEITGVEAYSPQSSDFSEPIKKLVGVHSLYRRLPEPPDEKTLPEIQFEALFIPDSADRAGMILPQLAYHDVEDVQIVGTNLWHSLKLLELGRRHAIGAIMPSGFYPESKRPAVRQFMARYEEAYQATPGYLEAVVFDSMMVLFHALEQTPYSREHLKNLLVTMPPFPGVTGNISFSETREAMTRPYLLRVTGQGFTEITP